MQDFVTVTGMVIKAIPISDYDRRITILTKERGKIGVFAKGARRMNNRFMAPTNPFSFGIFKLYEGKSSYNLADVQIQNYFENLREDFEGAYLGMYFLRQYSSTDFGSLMVSEFLAYCDMVKSQLEEIVIPDLEEMVSKSKDSMVLKEYRNYYDSKFPD